MKKILLIAIIGMMMGACQESLEKQAERTMREYSKKNCPVPLGETIVLDSCRFEAATHTMHYFYRFMGMMDNDSLIGARSEEMRQTLLNALKNEMKTRTYKEAGYNFQYTYFSEKEQQKMLLDVVLTKEDYQ